LAECLANLLEASLASSVSFFVFDVIWVGEAVIAQQDQVFAT
jgi:hypothetical protein